MNQIKYPDTCACPAVYIFTFIKSK